MPTANVQGKKDYLSFSFENSQRCTHLSLSKARLNNLDQRSILKFLSRIPSHFTSIEFSGSRLLFSRSDCAIKGELIEQSKKMFYLSALCLLLIFFLASSHVYSDIQKTYWETNELKDASPEAHAKADYVFGFIWLPFLICILTRFDIYTEASISRRLSFLNKHIEQTDYTPLEFIEAVCKALPVTIKTVNITGIQLEKISSAIKLAKILSAENREFIFDASTDFRKRLHKYMKEERSMLALLVFCRKYPALNSNMLSKHLTPFFKRRMIEDEEPTQNEDNTYSVRSL